MKLHVIIAILVALCFPVSAQEWVVPVEHTGMAREMIAVKDGEHILYVGSAPGRDGLVLKVDKEGNYITRQVHLPGKALQYYSAVQLGNGNYMAFGICDDSLADPHYQRYLRVDVFDSQLESVAFGTYDMDDEVTDLFSFPGQCRPMKSIMTRKGTALLAAAPAYHDPMYSYYHPIVRFFEFSEGGTLLRIVDNPSSTVAASSINAITYAPHSDNLMVFVADGNFGNASGVSGVMVADTSYTIVARQSLYHLGGVERVSDSGCDGQWIDGQYLIVDVEQYIGSSFTYHTLYKVDSALHVFGHHLLEPADSCAWVSDGRNTAYVNDSTIFAFSSFCHSLYSSSVYLQANIALFDKQLNLLGRKVIKEDDVRHCFGVPAVFNDGGCLVQVRSWSGSNYQGEPFSHYELMKLRREDIEITWDVVQENEVSSQAIPYPNPTNGILNILIGDADCRGARLQIFDLTGEKCFDCAINEQGNCITLNVQNLEAGMYVYRVISDTKETITGKFVKE